MSDSFNYDSPTSGFDTNIDSPSRCDESYDSFDLPEDPINDSLISGLHKLSFDILRSLLNEESKESSPGVVISPFAVWSTLLVSYMGARNETEIELRSALGLDDIYKESVRLAYDELRYKHQSKNNENQEHQMCEEAIFQNASKVFISDFLELSEWIKEHFSQETASMDFHSNPEAARGAINSWIEKETSGKIVDIIPPNGVNEKTRMIVANAVHFKAKWLERFDHEATQIGVFHVTPTEKLEVPLMHLQTEFKYYFNEALQCQALELPYSDWDFSMLILLPDSSKDIDSLVRQLEPIQLESIISNMAYQSISLVLPKFKVDQSFELTKTLKSIGIETPFDSKLSDFSGFFQQTNSSPIESLSMASVLHKVSIDVSEEEIEDFKTTMASYNDSVHEQFMVNRPFLFLIRNSITNVILFIGIVRRPSE